MKVENITYNNYEMKANENGRTQTGNEMGTSDKHYVKSVLKLVIIYIQQGSHKHDTQYLQAMRLSDNEIKIKQLWTALYISE